MLHDLWASEGPAGGYGAGFLTAPSSGGQIDQPPASVEPREHQGVICLFRPLRVLCAFMHSAHVHIGCMLYVHAPRGDVPYEQTVNLGRQWGQG